jgi:ribosomal protein RSM22 (predicted rRNA methylase)
MQSQLPLWLQQASLEALHGVSGKSLTRDYERLSTGYRSGKPGEAQISWLAYLAARMPATYAAISAVLSQIPESFQSTCQSMLDLGSGPGTACWSALERFPKLEKIQALEQDKAALELAGRLSQGARFRPEFIGADLQDGLKEVEPADLVLAAYVANEFEDADKRAALFDAAWAKTRRLLVWVEPGTPQGFEIILQLRAQLLALGAKILAPCPREAACPLAANPREKWCHFSQRLERSRISKLAKVSELGYEDEKFSYLILAKDAQGLRGAAARVLGRPKKLEGQVLLELCGPQGLQSLKLSRRDKSRYKAAKKAEWGDLWNPE